MREEVVELAKQLARPSEEFSPIPFWFLNDRLTKEEIKGQLQDFKEKGVDGVVLHPRMGIPGEMGYLSDEYFRMISYAVETAAQLQMTVVLYDEAMYPSGSAHGRVVEENPEYASIGLTITKDQGSGELVARLQDGSCLVWRHCGGTIRGIHFGEDDGEQGAPASADILNPDAVDAFIRLTHERYYEKLGQYFGTTIIGFFTDEPCVLGRNVTGYADWTKGLEKDILARGGSLEELKGLFAGVENRTVTLYREAVRERLQTVYYGRLSGWCQAHGIVLMGHPGNSDDIEEETYFGIPGQDLVFSRVSPERGGVDGMDSVQAKCSSDAARHMGRRRNANECFGVCVRDGIPWYMTAFDMKWFIDYLGVRGVNMFIPHAFFYSVRDGRSGERPPDVGPHNIWWKYYRYFSTYMKRVSCLMTDACNCATVAVLCASSRMPYEEVKPLYEHQIEFNYLQKNLFGQCRTENGKLKIAGYEYRYVMDPFGLAEENGLVLTGVPLIRHWWEIEGRELLTCTDMPKLRATHLVKNGVDLYFLVNEGPETIEGEVSVPWEGGICLADLWSGEFRRAEGINREGRVFFRLSLEPGMSRLLMPEDGAAVGAMVSDKEAFPAEKGVQLHKAEALQTAGRKESVTVEPEKGWMLVEENLQMLQKVYMAKIECEAPTGCEILSVQGEEMAECWCNGAFVGVGFFGKHSFHIGPWLRAGCNECRLAFTGNIANRYSNTAIPYGLMTPAVQSDRHR